MLVVERPWILPATLTVREGRDRYLAANGFSTDVYEAPTYEVDLYGLLGFVLTFRNGPSRRRAIPLHDLHHVATGYGTDLIGEAEIGAFELVGGCNSLFLWWINLGAVLVGFLISPGRVLAAGLRARGRRTLYRDREPYECLLDLSVGELRGRMRVPLEGQAEHTPRLHRRAPTED